MTSGWQGAPYRKEIRPGAGSKTGDFVEEKLYRRTTLHSSLFFFFPEIFHSRGAPHLFRQN